MLVLNRKVGESIIFEVGDQTVEMRVAKINTLGTSVRLGFIGPRCFKIIRKEVMDRLENGNA